MMSDANGDGERSARYEWWFEVYTCVFFCALDASCKSRWSSCWLGIKRFPTLSNVTAFLSVGQEAASSSEGGSEAPRGMPMCVCGNGAKTRVHGIGSSYARKSWGNWRSCCSS